MCLEVPFVELPSDIEKSWVCVFDRLKKQPIANVSWEKINHQPVVAFKIAHSQKTILLQFDVQEQETRAVYSKHNDPVYKDSCVEFFVAFDGDSNYYNFEFNVLGTCLAAYGSDRYSRKSFSAKQINKINSQSQIQRTGDLINWKLSLKIPIEIFIHTERKNLTGVNAKANFYKCGDDLLEAHFLSWKMIETPTPDFHQPTFFGKLKFL